MTSRVSGTQHKAPVQAFTQPAALRTFQSALVSLESARAALTEHLDAKRRIFPRLLLLSDSELMTLLAAAKDPPSVQFLVRKLFAGAARLEFEGLTLLAWIMSAQQVMKY
jgi:Dynein heavy chain, N-terminal region 2